LLISSKLNVCMLPLKHESMYCMLRFILTFVDLSTKIVPVYLQATENLISLVVCLSYTAGLILTHDRKYETQLLRRLGG